MGRRKIEIKAIKDDRNRSVTFLKRKGGLFKKAHELSVLCSVDVAVIIFGHNKKLYEFSSGDINETIGRYQYYGQPHEHKGPADFRGKGGDDDDDEDDDEDIAHAREDSAPPPQHAPMIPPHLQHQNSFPQLRHQAPSASPPMPNGMFQRHSTPQPHMSSRPSSRNQVRRTSSNLVPVHQTPPPPPQNGFPYVPNPPVYNPQANPNMQHPPHPSPQPQFQQFQHHGGPPPQHHQTSQPPQNRHVQQAHQAYIQEQRRQSMPQSLPRQESLQPPQHVPQRASPQLEHQATKPPDTSSPPRPKHLSSKSRSIFTPIDDGGSVLAAHFFGAPEPPRSNVKTEGPTDSRPPTRGNPPGPALSRSMPNLSKTPSMPSEFPPPFRTDTGNSKSGAARPRLALQIPSEASDNGSATAESSPAAAAVVTPARGSSDSHHSSAVVLPPPSPSASALLSAGATGPPNPFARPPPPGANNQNSSAYNDNRNNIDTPISALPSRFVADNLLPSPSSFYPEWGFGRSGPDSNMLPSPLTFPTPINPAGPSLGRGDSEGIGEKRRGSEERPAEAKKVKV